MSHAICLNVGGVYFYTTTDTLSKSHNFFSALMQNNGTTTENDAIFIDRDPTHFRYILNWLRGSTVLPEDSLSIQELMVEADFYSITNLVLALRLSKQTSSTILSELQHISKYMKP